MSHRSAAMAAAMATAEVSDPPRPSVVMRPVAWCMPWKPEITATSPRSLKRRISSAPLTSSMRAVPCASLVRMGNCQPCHERALTPHAFDHEGEKSRRDLLARGHHGVVFARIVQGRGLLAPGHELVGLAHHGRNHHGHVVARRHLALDMARDVANAVDIGDRRSAELHHQARHARLPEEKGRRHRSSGEALRRERPIHTGGVALPQPRANRRKQRATAPFAPNGVRRDGFLVRCQDRMDVRTGSSQPGELSERMGMRHEARPGATTVDEAEVARFDAMAAVWWDPHGEMRALHMINPVRLRYIRNAACQHFGRDPKRLDCLKDLRMLDIGCGAGLLSEPLARLGASMVGADAAETNIKMAAAHAAAAGLTIDYRAVTAEALADAGERFDVVLAMEVVEHVADMPLFIGRCAEMVKPGGLMIIATINRTL